MVVVVVIVIVGGTAIEDRVGVEESSANLDPFKFHRSDDAIHSQVKCSPCPTESC